MDRRQKGAPADIISPLDSEEVRHPAGADKEQTKADQNKENTKVSRDRKAKEQRASEVIAKALHQQAPEAVESDPETEQRTGLLEQMLPEGRFRAHLTLFDTQKKKESSDLPKEGVELGGVTFENPQRRLTYSAVATSCQETG